MTSYQRLKQRLQYSRQREKELEHLLQRVDQHLKKRGLVVDLGMGSTGLRGDQFLTDINMGRAQLGLTNIKGDFQQWSPPLAVRRQDNPS